MSEGGVNHEPGAWFTSYVNHAPRDTTVLPPSNPSPPVGSVQQFGLCRWLVWRKGESKTRHQQNEVSGLMRAIIQPYTHIHSNRYWFLLRAEKKDTVCVLSATCALLISRLARKSLMSTWATHVP